MSILLGITCIAACGNAALFSSEVMMYKELDRRILDAVKRNKSPLHDGAVSREAERIAAQTGREAFRVTDGRLQLLRKKKRIRWLTKTEALGHCGGWRLVAT